MEYKCKLVSYLVYLVTSGLTGTQIFAYLFRSCKVFLQFLLNFFRIFKNNNNFLPILASKRRFSSLIRDPLPAWELISSCKSSRSASAALLARSAELRSCFKGKKRRFIKYIFFLKIREINFSCTYLLHLDEVGLTRFDFLFQFFVLLNGLWFAQVSFLGISLKFLECSYLSKIE